MSKEIVLETFMASAKPLRAAEVAEQSGLDKAEVDKHVKALKKEGKITSPKVCFYEAVR